MTHTTHVGEFDMMLREAVEASNAVDNYDLRSENPANVQKWNALLSTQQQAMLSVVKFVEENAEALKRGINEVCEPLAVPAD